MSMTTKAFLVGGGIGSLAAAAFMIRDGDLPGGNITILDVEIPDDVVFTVEYSVRAAQMAVYELLDIKREIPVVTPHAKSLQTQFEALLKAFK